jgi:hypothetical protein
MSEYCLLANSLKDKEVGPKLFQTQGLPDGYTVRFFDSPNSMTKLNNKEFPKENPELIWQMEPTSILTDVVRPGNITAKGLLCNNKVREILESHNLCEHRFYPATLIHEGKELKYQWFHPIEQDLDIIDFEKSEFALTDFAFYIKKILKIKNVEDFIQEKSKKFDDYFFMIVKPIFFNWI